MTEFRHENLLKYTFIIGTIKMSFILEFGVYVGLRSDACVGIHGGLVRSSPWNSNIDTQNGHTWKETHFQT